MTTYLDANSELFLAQANRIQDQLAEANRQVSSGKRMETPSDVPDEVGALLQLRAAQQHNEQIQANLVLAKTDADTADQTLTAAIKLMDRAVSLANQGATSTMTADGRKQIALDVQSLLEQMVAYSRTVVQGRYIFSGDDNQTPAYEVNAGKPNGVNVLSSSPATVRIEDASGSSFTGSKTAADIFDQHAADGSIAPENVFFALNQLRMALDTNDQPTVVTAIGNIKQASYHLNAMQAFYGSVQHRIQDASDFSSRYATEVQTQISQKEDADVVAAALAVTRGNTQLQAAFQMRAQLPHTSLFDYLG